MSLKDLLAERGIKAALVVDDAFDKVPKAGDIVDGERTWPTFNDDLTAAQKQKIVDAFPPAGERPFNELFIADDYVAAVWGLRDELGEAAATLFATYVADQAADEKYLETLQNQLSVEGLTCEVSGRDFFEKAKAADLIVIDLYLGQSQDDAAFEISKDVLTRVIQARNGQPPLVILMSRSTRLEAKRDEFRDKVGLLDSAFRIVRKADLAADGVLQLQLQRLADNFDDTRKLATFVDAIEKGLGAAASRTLTLLRRLKLSDVGQIQQLLLEAEGEPTGSYLVDVFDRVFQHEIERDNGIIEAAKGLNTFTALNHPPPYVAGSPDLQELVSCLVSQNERRLDLPGSTDSAVAFGDLLMLGEIAEGQNPLLKGLAPNQVLVVLTPACDLQRGGAPRAFLLVGEVRDLSRDTWAYKEDARTPAIRLDGKLKWIKWDIKHVATALITDIDADIKAHRLKLAGRLREIHALELQQRTLAGLGRVGQVAALPATFPVELDVYYAGADDRPSLLAIPELKDGAVCWVGRDKDSNPMIRLMTTEMVDDGIVRALKEIKKENVAAKAQLAFEHVITSSDLGRRLAAGLDLKGVGNAKWAGIASETGGNKVPAMGVIAWNKPSPVDKLDRGDLIKAGVIFHIKDVAGGAGPGLADAVRAGAMQELAPVDVSTESANAPAVNGVSNSGLEGKAVDPVEDIGETKA